MTLNFVRIKFNIMSSMKVVSLLAVTHYVLPEGFLKSSNVWFCYHFGHEDIKLNSSNVRRVIELGLANSVTWWLARELHVQLG